MKVSRQTKISGLIKSDYYREQAFLWVGINPNQILVDDITVIELVRAANEYLSDLLHKREGKEKKSISFKVIGQKINSYLDTNRPELLEKLRHTKERRKYLLTEANRIENWVATNRQNLSQEAIESLEKTSIDFRNAPVDKVTQSEKTIITELLYYLIVIKKLLSIDELKKIPAIELSRQFRISTGIELSRQYWDEKKRTSFHPDVKNRNKEKKMAKMNKDLALKYKDL
jgi:hypothetical protein